jgi:tRNA-2-methylthio-N6-dimethylallyladenosine synthase
MPTEFLNTPLPGLSRGAVKAPTAYIETYGCQMNVSDSGLVGGILRRAGCRIVDRPEGADLILLNTCAVREKAEVRIVGRVGQLASLKERHPVRIGILGCMAQHLRDDLWDQVPHVDFILGPDAYRRLPEVLDLAPGQRLSLCQLDRTELYEGLPPIRSDGAPTAFVTVMRGCDRMCTFCVVPMTRGRERCRSVDDIVGEVDGLVAAGVREVTLLGQTVNAWRHDGLSFDGLLRRVSETGIDRIRFTSPHPVYYREDELEAIADCPNVCEWVHLPLQSGSDVMLDRMARGYSRREYLDLVTRLRARVSDVTLTTDLIVGFPGETETHFEETLEVMAEVAFDSAYMFKYSPREGTRAHREFPDDVPEETKQARLERVIELQTRLTRASHEAMVGRDYELLVTEPGTRGPDQWLGRTRGNKAVIVASDEDMTGRLVTARIEDVGSWTLRGRILRIAESGP